MIADGEGLHAEFQTAEGDYDFSLIGGEPFSIQRVRLKMIE